MSDFYEVVAPAAQIDLPTLLINLKKACGLWFLTEHSSTSKLANELPSASSFDHITSTTVEILRHGLRLTMQASKYNFSNCPVGESLYQSHIEAVKKLMDDFEWVKRSVQTRSISTAGSSKDVFDSSSSIQSPQLTSPPNVSCPVPSIESFLYSWVLCNLKANCLCTCLQVLVEEKELLQNHYIDYAFLRNEAYSTALFICLTSIELNHYSLLSQIEVNLCSPPPLAATRHRRSNSHPVFSISPLEDPRVDSKQGNKERHNTVLRQNIKKTNKFIASIPPRNYKPPFRKIKSLPAIHEALIFASSLTERPRCKTMFGSAKDYRYAREMSSLNTSKTLPSIGIPSNARTVSYDFANNTDGPIYPESESMYVTQTSKSATNQSVQKSDISQQLMSTPSTSASSCSSHVSPALQIDLINCDDIKIWTDQAYEQKERKQQQQQQQHHRPTEPFNIPQQTEPYKQKAKSVSPIVGSFLCNLFSTPPTYTHWSLRNQGECSSIDTSDTNDITTVPCNTQPSDLSNSVGVFDSFLPVCGKKLRSRNSQSLFEDGISSLDYTSTTNKPIEVSETTSPMTDKNTALPKYQQTLTDFLQNSQMSRNNTELEKENAHFRISEAIISAIEHMKWSNAEPGKKWRRRKEATGNLATVTATDWLAGDQYDRKESTIVTESSLHDNSSEHISYAELGESCLDLLSAEVVGLSLISKFNDKHLPKVSELKWLVSEEDTPQQLLPMPDNSPSSNPDENIVRPMTRGTRYWAPPRQQIIFTEHPPSNRKILIKKQNSRCAGCGMRVSPQHINSFRYCTYLGKYHCTGCHRNQITLIPSKILQSWDFKCYPVSVFAYRLLDQMYTFPLFYVPDLNPVLYVNNKPLLMARKKRVQLQFIRDFVKTCRFAVREQVYFEGIPSHITCEPDIWSLSDFVDVNNKSMARSIDQLIEKCENHIFNCVLCTARGFHCEYCQRDQVIYPWQQKVFRCDRCGGCFHLSCWKSMSETCCRCQRISKRQEVWGI